MVVLCQGKRIRGTRKSTLRLLGGKLLGVGLLLLMLSPMSPFGGTSPLWAKDKNKDAKRSGAVPEGGEKRFPALVDQLLYEKGHRKQIPDYIAHDLGLANVYLPVRTTCFALETEDGMHSICAMPNEVGKSVLMTVNTGSTPLVYVCDRNGVLEQAARIVTVGKLQGRESRRIPLNDVRSAFEAERDFWLGLVGPGSAVSSDLASPTEKPAPSK